MASFKFGEDLEIDSGAYELRRGGRPVRLERIPMEMLLLLVEHRGDLVTREQIIERVWGQGVFLDTDNSINGAIRKLRQALRDDPESPRFISTVTGKGYRFIAPQLGGETRRPEVIPPPPMPAAPTVDVSPAPGARSWPLFLAVVVLAGSAGAYLLWPRSPSDPRQSGGRVMLAVLPFENLTGDPGQDYFSDGLTEEMITRVGNLAPQGLGVIARTSVMRYKTHPALDEIGRELGVDYVLEGSVRRDADGVRITAQLIQLNDQTHVWARQYDRDPSEVLSVQAEIAQAIADQIEITFGEDRTPPAQPAALSPRELEAYDHYLRGRFFWNKRTPEDFEHAIASFEQAIAMNPGEARAYAGLADTYGLLGTWGFSPPDDVIPKAREAALKALQIDERLAAAHTSLALINEFYDRDWQTAEDRFRRAIELDLNYVTAHHWFAEYLGFQGRFEEAVAEIDRARQLDPLSPIIAVDQGKILYYAGQYDLAIQRFRFVLEMEPRFEPGRFIIAVYLQQGKFEEALAQIEEWRETQPGPWFLAWAAHVYGRVGRQAEARQALKEVEKTSRGLKNGPLLLITAYLGMGLNDEALVSLQHVCEERSGFLGSLKVDPMYDGLRTDPRFADLLRCAGLGL